MAVAGDLEVSVVSGLGVVFVGSEAFFPVGLSGGFDCFGAVVFLSLGDLPAQPLYPVLKLVLSQHFPVLLGVDVLAYNSFTCW